MHSVKQGKPLGVIAAAVKHNCKRILYLCRILILIINQFLIFIEVDIELIQGQSPLDLL